MYAEHELGESDHEEIFDHKSHQAEIETWLKFLEQQEELEDGGENQVSNFPSPNPESESEKEREGGGAENEVPVVRTASPGLWCLDGVGMADRVEKRQMVQCHRKNVTQCHQSYVTHFEPHLEKVTRDSAHYTA